MLDVGHFILNLDGGGSSNGIAITLCTVKAPALWISHEVTRFNLLKAAHFPPYGRSPGADLRAE